MNTQDSFLPGATRRDFLRTSAVTVAGLGLAGAFAPPVHAAGSDTIKVALIGCGNRGSAALVQALNTGDSVKLWAMADAFPDRLEKSLRNIERELTESPESDDSEPHRKKKKAVVKGADKINVPKERQFLGLDAYRKAIDC